MQVNYFSYNFLHAVPPHIQESHGNSVTTLHPAIPFAQESSPLQRNLPDPLPFIAYAFNCPR